MGTKSQKIQLSAMVLSNLYQINKSNKIKRLKIWKILMPYFLNCKRDIQEIYGVFQQFIIDFLNGNGYPPKILNIENKTSERIKRSLDLEQSNSYSKMTLKSCNRAKYKVTVNHM